MTRKPAKPQVSVALIASPRAPALGEAIESIVAQSFTDWELIVVDDGSTDDAPALMRRYCAQDSRIRYLRQAHCGRMAAGLNLALAHARGRYFCCQGASDLSCPDRLEKCVAYMDAHEQEAGVREQMEDYVRAPDGEWQWGGAARPHAPLFWRSANLRALGGWNEFYPLAANADLCARAQSRFALGRLPQLLYIRRRPAPTASDKRRRAVYDAIWRAEQARCPDHWPRPTRQDWPPQLVLRSLVRPRRARCWPRAGHLRPWARAASSFSFSFSLTQTGKRSGFLTPTGKRSGFLAQTGKRSGAAPRRGHSLLRAARAKPPQMRLVSLPRVTVALVARARSYAPEDVCAAMDSIRRQSWPHWRLLVWDDGLSDAMRAQLAHYEGRDARIRRVLSPRRLGMADALNQLLEGTRTEYFCRQDVEAISHPERLAHHIAALEAAPASIGVQSDAPVKDFLRRGAPRRAKMRGLVNFFRQRDLRRLGGWPALDETALPAGFPFADDVMMRALVAQAAARCVQLGAAFYTYDAALLPQGRAHMHEPPPFLHRSGLGPSYWRLSLQRGARRHASASASVWPRLMQPERWRAAALPKAF